MRAHTTANTYTETCMYSNRTGITKKRGTWDTEWTQKEAKHVKKRNRSDWRSFPSSLSRCADASAFSCSASNISRSCGRIAQAHKHTHECMHFRVRKSTDGMSLDSCIHKCTHARMRGGHRMHVRRGSTSLTNNARNTPADECAVQVQCFEAALPGAVPPVPYAESSPPHIAAPCLPPAPRPRKLVPGILPGISPMPARASQAS